MRSRSSTSQRESPAGNVLPSRLFRTTAYRAVPCILLLTSVPFLADCGAGSTGSLASGQLISISPQPASVPVNGTVTFTATTAVSGSTVTWAIVCGVPGTLSSTTGNTVTYTAPAQSPIYTVPCNGLAGGGDGWIVLKATANDFFSSSDEVSFPVTGTEWIGLSPLTTTVALGGTEQFLGYAVGTTNTGLTWQVNGVTGGSAATGTISNTVTADYEGGLYTAPTVMPITGSTVTITVISQGDPTKTLTATVTLH